MTHTTFDIPYRRQTLGNRLDVIVHEDHSCPIVAVNVWYHVGSKDEAPGRTGFAHLFEHLMFEGSAHHDGSYFEPIQRAGGQLNGSTNTDRTNYWEVVPSNAVELAVWMESDRMGHLLPALTDEKFHNQRDVVLNERRQNYENRPYGLAPVALMAALFPAAHPYSWMTIGSPDDLRAASLAEVHAFFRRFYHPANASLALAGDISHTHALELVERYFGDIPPGEKPGAAEPAPSALAPRRLVLEDRVELPRLYLAWLTPALFTDGDAECDLLANVLGGGKASRLYRRLVYEQRVATDVSAYQASRELGGFFQIAATAVPGTTLETLEGAIMEEVARLADQGPTSEERDRSVALTESAFWSRLEHVGGFGGKADQLNGYNVHRGDPGWFGHDLARYTDAEVASMRESARRFLAAADRVTLSVVPSGRRATAAPDSQAVEVS
ncbi:MAG: pitrilysin family protein [Acidobacteriota bacterium]